MSLTEPVDIIFIGNTGSGKSTLIASLSQNESFQGGVSFGTGKTKFLNFQEDKRPGYTFVRWADTPGLADIKIIDQAANEISLALKNSVDKNRATILIFVCTLQAGRVRVEDINTINCVTKAIQLADGKPLSCNSYAVLYNQVPKRLMERDDWLTGKVFIQECFSNKSSNFAITTNHFIYIPKINELEDADNGWFTADQLAENGLYEKIFGCPRIKIDAVQKIDTKMMVDPEAIKTIQKEHEKMRQQLLNDFDAQNKKAEAIRQQEKQQFETMITNLNSQIQSLQAQRLPIQ